MKNKDFLFGDFFDINGDGETDIFEEYMAYKLMTDTREEKMPDLDRYIPNTQTPQRRDWRCCEKEGYSYGITPYDYKTREEYIKALQKVKYAWRETAPDGYEYGLDPAFFETEEEYLEKLEEINITPAKPVVL